MNPGGSGRFVSMQIVHKADAVEEPSMLIWIKQTEAERSVIIFIWLFHSLLGDAQHLAIYSAVWLPLRSSWHLW